MADLGPVRPHVLWRLVGVLVLLGGLAGSDLLAPPDLGAQVKCEVDAGGGCKVEGKSCSPPANGKCVTKKRSTIELVCECEAPPPKDSGGGALALAVFLATAAAWHYWRRR